MLGRLWLRMRRGGIWKPGFSAFRGLGSGRSLGANGFSGQSLKDLS